MLRKLAQEIQLGIIDSISTVFENYMADLNWDEEKFDIQQFMDLWRIYIQTSTDWFHQLDEDVKMDANFHEDVANSINETIEYILNEEPSEEQINEIEKLQKILGTDYEYTCRLEAEFIIEKLKEELREKQHLLPADEKQIKLASLMYYRVYGEDLPHRDYKQQDIEYIIEELRKSLKTGEEVFKQEILH